MQAHYNALPSHGSLDNDIDKPNEQGLTCLQVAAKEGDVFDILQLLSKGASVNATCKLKIKNEYNKKIEAQKSALHLAVERGHYLVAQILLISGADIASAKSFARKLRQDKVVQDLQNLSIIPVFIKICSLWAIDNNSAAYLRIIAPQIQSTLNVNRNEHRIQMEEKKDDEYIPIADEYNNDTFDSNDLDGLRDYAATKQLNDCLSILGNIRDPNLRKYNIPSSSSPIATAFAQRNFIQCKELINKTIQSEDKEEFLLQIVTLQDINLKYFVLMSLGINPYVTILSQIRRIENQATLQQIRNELSGLFYFQLARLIKPSDSRLSLSDTDKKNIWKLKSSDEQFKEIVDQVICDRFTNVEHENHQITMATIYNALRIPHNIPSRTNELTRFADGNIQIIISFLNSHDQRQLELTSSWARNLIHAAGYRQGRVAIRKSQLNADSVEYDVTCQKLLLISEFIRLHDEVMQSATFFSYRNKKQTLLLMLFFITMIIVFSESLNNFIPVNNQANDVFSALKEIPVNIIYATCYGWARTSSNSFTCATTLLNRDNSFQRPSQCDPGCDELARLYPTWAGTLAGFVISGFSIVVSIPSVACYLSQEKDRLPNLSICALPKNLQNNAKELIDLFKRTPAVGVENFSLQTKIGLFKDKIFQQQSALTLQKTQLQAKMQIARFKPA